MAVIVMALRTRVCTSCFSRASCAFDTLLAAGDTAENVAAADNDDDLHPEFADFGDLRGHVVDGLRVNARRLGSSQRLPAEFQQDALEPGGTLGLGFFLHRRAALYQSPHGGSNRLRE
jgi:hypothetical protein